MRIASYNVENMFRRPVALNQATWAQGRPYLEAYSALQTLLEEPVYSDAEKTRILELLEKLGLLNSDESKWAILRRTRGSLLSRGATVRVTAAGRGDWIGWLELKREAVNETATRNTARVIAEVPLTSSRSWRPRIGRRCCASTRTCCRTGSPTRRHRGATGT
jgi:hypothetical protein